MTYTPEKWTHQIEWIDEGNSFVYRFTSLADAQTYADASLSGVRYIIREVRG